MSNGIRTLCLRIPRLHGAVQLPRLPPTPRHSSRRLCSLVSQPLTPRLDGAVQLPRGLPLLLLAVRGAVAQVAAAGAHPVCCEERGREVRAGGPNRQWHWDSRELRHTQGGAPKSEQAAAAHLAMCRTPSVSCTHTSIAILTRLLKHLTHVLGTARLSAIKELAIKAGSRRERPSPGFSSASSTCSPYRANRQSPHSWPCGRQGLRCRGKPMQPQGCSECAAAGTGPW